MDEAPPRETELKFLVEVHKLKKVVLIAHQGCAFYSTRLELKEPRLELVQRAAPGRVTLTFRVRTALPLRKEK